MDLLKDIVLLVGRKAVEKMSKAILVIDMPKNCAECPLVEIHGDEYFCIPDDFNHYLGDSYVKHSCEQRPNWCPLKEMPQKPDYPPINESSYVAGYNACIDKILEGSEQNETD